MFTLCLFEDDAARHLAPLVATRHTADLLLGVRTIAERHVDAFQPGRLAFLARPEVAGVTAQEHPDALVNELPKGDGVLFVNARWTGQDHEGEHHRLVAYLTERMLGHAPHPSTESWCYVEGDTLVAAWSPSPLSGAAQAWAAGDLALGVEMLEMTGPRESAGYTPSLLNRLPDLIDDVPGRIAWDVDAMRERLPRATTLGQGAIVIGEDVFCAPDAVIQPGAVVSSENGPVVIGAGATVGHNAVVEGPCAIGPKAVVKSMARVDGSAIGYWAKVGGEVHESVVHSLSSKGHDGYLGNSYLGRWCNLGADTNTSNLKNDYGEVTVYDRVQEDFVPSGRQFAGLFMGDHAKCSINTMFNTGSVVGVFANLFGAGFPPRHVPDFSWGGADALVPYRLGKAFRVAEAVMARRGHTLTDADRLALETAFGAAHGSGTD